MPRTACSAIRSSRRRWRPRAQDSTMRGARVSGSHTIGAYSGRRRCGRGGDGAGGAGEAQGLAHPHEAQNGGGERERAVGLVDGPEDRDAALGGPLGAAAEAEGGPPEEELE